MGRSTNFAVWISSDFYPRTLDGLAACYVAALPFFGNSTVGNLIYSCSIFGGWALAERRFPVLAPARSMTVVA